jgi:hypothetical protein
MHPLYKYLANEFGKIPLYGLTVLTTTLSPKISLCFVRLDVVLCTGLRKEN